MVMQILFFTPPASVIRCRGDPPQELARTYLVLVLNVVLCERTRRPRCGK